MASTIPTARANLYTMLRDKPSLADVQVTYGPPEAHTEEKVVVGILGVSNITTTDAAIGGNRQAESYAINMRIKVWDPTCNGDADELAALDAQAWGLYEDVREAVQADRTLNGALSSGYATVAVAGDDFTEESPTLALDDNNSPMGWVDFIPLQVLCNARIT